MGLHNLTKVGAFAFCSGAAVWQVYCGYAGKTANHSPATATPRATTERNVNRAGNTAG